jgi:hypothetical protein
LGYKRKGGEKIESIMNGFGGHGKKIHGVKGRCMMLESAVRGWMRQGALLSVGREMLATRQSF